MVFSKKKGISPLISSVLLVVFVVAIGGLTMNWLTSYTKSTTEKVDNASTTNIACSRVNLDITEVFMVQNTTSGNTTIRAVVSNMGDAATLVQSTAYNTVGQSCRLTGTTSLAKGALETFANESNCSAFNTSLDCADLDRVVITTTCGTTSTFKYSDGPECSSVS